MQILKTLLLRMIGIEKEIASLQQELDQKNQDYNKLNNKLNRIQRALAFHTESDPQTLDDILLQIKKYSPRNTHKVVIEKHYIGDDDKLRQVVGDFLLAVDNEMHTCIYCGHHEDIEFDKLDDLRKAYDNA